MFNLTRGYIFAISINNKTFSNGHQFELSGRPLPPFRLIGVNNEWNARYETIQQAKYYLKKQYYNIKWIR